MAVKPRRISLPPGVKPARSTWYVGKALPETPLTDRTYTVGYWPFVDRDLRNLVNGHSLEVLGAPVFDAEQNPGFLLSTDALRSSLPYSIPANERITLSVWCKFTALTTNRQRIVTLKNLATWGGVFFLEYYASTSKFRLYARASDGTWSSVECTAVTPEINHWYNITGQVNPNDTSMHIWVDGANQNSKVVTALSSGLYESVGRIRFGSGNNIASNLYVRSAVLFAGGEPSNWQQTFLYDPYAPIRKRRVLVPVSKGAGASHKRRRRWYYTKLSDGSVIVSSRRIDVERQVTKKVVSQSRPEAAKRKIRLRPTKQERREIDLALQRVKTVEYPRSVEFDRVIEDLKRELHRPPQPERAQRQEEPIRVIDVKPEPEPEPYRWWLDPEIRARITLLLLAA